MLLPSSNTWLAERLINDLMTVTCRPQIASEFEGSSLLKVLWPEDGLGLFPGPWAIEKEILSSLILYRRSYRGGPPRAFSISFTENKHPAVVGRFDDELVKNFSPRSEWLVLRHG